jgi:ubiquinone/menaquinone biosynthesis C-methylase UbiE
MSKHNQNQKNDDHSLVKNQFSRVAEKYTSSPVHAKKEDLDFAVSLIKAEKHWNVIDLATGTANFAIALSPYVNHVLATDITEKMLVEGKKTLTKKNIKNIDLEIADVHNLQYENDKFDLTVVRIAPHHFNDIEKAIQEMVRVTKANGYIFVEDTVAPSNKEASIFLNHIEKLRDPSHIRDLSKSEWVEYFRRNSCEVLTVEIRAKKWPLTWWTDQMKTSEENVKEINRLLTLNYEKYSQAIDIRKFEPEDEEWTIYPNNIYLLAKKK